MESMGRVRCGKYGKGEMWKVWEGRDVESMGELGVYRCDMI